MRFFRTHWIAITVGLVLFLVGIGIGEAGKGSTKTETQTVAGPTTTRDLTVTVNRVRTVIKRIKRPRAAALSFRGNGGLTLRPFDLDHDATMYWTDDGGLMQIFDNNPNAPTPVPVNSQASRGKTFMPAGHYELQVNSAGNWTIRIK